MKEAPPLERLKRIHRLNAWLMLALMVSGIVLYVPEWRGALAEWRVALKWVHIAIGIGWSALLAFYLLELPRHLRSLQRALGKRLNLAAGLALAAAWAGSGLVLTQDRILIGWTLPALWLHDAASIAGLIYLGGHVFVRSFNLHLPLPWAKPPAPRRALEADQLARYHLARAIQRRRLLVGGLQAAAGLVALGYGWRWLIRASGSDQTPSAPAWPEGTPMPQPLPASAPPQGGGAAGRFRIYNVAPKLPVWDPASWRLAVDGLVDKPLRLTWTELLKIPRMVLVRDFHCVTGWSVYHVTWEGVLLDDLLDYVGVQEGATHVKFHAYDNEYTDALSLGQARLPDVMVALLKDGKPLTQEEGQPLRLLVPQMFGYKSVKWLTRIELIDSAHIGFWERLGYSNDAWLRRDHPRV